jgi:hypothetical protein
VVLGIDWTESHRCHPDWFGIPTAYPMTEAPYLTKAQMFAEVEADGIAIPRLYKLGYQHNNCGGGCVRGGIKAWAHHARTLPNEFAKWEALESLIPGATFARSRKNVLGSASSPLPLSKIREDEEANLSFDWGGCGCFVEDRE